MKWRVTGGKYSTTGSTLSAVNFLEGVTAGACTVGVVCCTSTKPPGLTAINQSLPQGVNIAAQYHKLISQMGYVVIDIEADEDVAELKHCRA